MVTKVNVDFTSVKDSSGINPKQMPEGDYHATIKKVELVAKKSDPDAKQLLFTIGIKESATASYPYYCGFEANVLWKLRNLMLAAGVKAPKKAFSFDAEKLVGKDLGVTLADDEYDGKMKSVIDACFPVTELEEVSATEEPDTDSDIDELDDDVTEAPAKAKKAAAAAAPVEEEDDELDLDAL